MGFNSGFKGLNTWHCEDYRYVSTRTSEHGVVNTNQVNNEKTDYVVVAPDHSKLLK